MASNGNRAWLLYVVSAFVGFAILVGVAFAKSTDTRLIKNNDEHREIRQDVSGVQSDIREIKTQMVYVQRDVGELKTHQQKGFDDIKEMIRGIRGDT